MQLLQHRASLCTAGHCEGGSVQEPWATSQRSCRMACRGRGWLMLSAQNRVVAVSCPRAEPCLTSARVMGPSRPARPPIIQCIMVVLNILFCRWRIGSRMSRYRRQIWAAECLRS